MLSHPVREIGDTQNQGQQIVPKLLIRQEALDNHLSGESVFFGFHGRYLLEALQPNSNIAGARPGQNERAAYSGLCSTARYETGGDLLPKIYALPGNAPGEPV